MFLLFSQLQTKNDDSRVELLKVPTAAASATGTATGIPSAPSGVCRTSPVHATGLTTETTTSTTSTNTSSTTVTARAASPDRSPPPQQHHHHHHSHQHGTPLHHAPSSHHQATSCEFHITFITNRKQPPPTYYNFRKNYLKIKPLRYYSYL